MTISIWKALRKPIWWIGQISNTLSTAILLTTSFHLVVVAPIKQAFDLYSTITHALFSQWARPLVEIGLKYLGAPLDFQNSLARGWTNVFIILFVAASEIVRTRMADATSQRQTAIKILVLGAILSLVTAVLWGAAAAGANISAMWFVISSLAVLLVTDFLVTGNVDGPSMAPVWRFLGMFLLMFIFSLYMEFSGHDSTMAETNDLIAIVTLFLIAIVTSYALVAGKRVGQAILISYLTAGLVLVVNAGMFASGIR